VSCYWPGIVTPERECTRLMVALMTSPARALVCGSALSSSEVKTLGISII